jgi:hypothetical protein
VVAQGDTLWGIAAEHSPARQGPAWVAIWKTNKALIKNYDRLEAGTRLAIPPKLEQYVMPYWRPRLLVTARKRPSRTLGADEVDVAELPVPRDDGWVDVAELPIPTEGDEVLLAELPCPEDIGPCFSAEALKPPSLIYWPYLHNQ